MAGGSEYFSIGSIVACKTCFGREIEGEVLAFDPQTKMLILKCPSSSGRPSLRDILFINLALVSDVQVKKEVTSVSDSPKSLNLNRLNTRLRNRVEEKKRLVTALKAGVPPEGQKLFMAISKTISEVSWSGVNIMVWNKVIITPPYKAENLSGDPDCKALPHIRKIVEKHIKDSLYQGNKN
ncbi:UNVERIFIED_CONTAM: hypothetical protein PYX00_004613 [Menopon gallinae]|uniref:LSM12 anticodon-binding domain-containing protein n=1 Tax=Menopon gallinae TaxID=328185 RepID=A0AAW2I4F0_9NEOP